MTPVGGVGRRRRQTGWTLPAPPSRKTSSMRWCRSCIRTRPRPRSTVRSRTTSGVASSRTSTSISAPPAGPGGQPGLDQRLAQQPVGVGPALHLDDQAAGGVQEVGGGRGLQQPAAVEHDDVVADPLELAEQVRGDQHRDAELVPDPAHQREHVVARRTGRGRWSARRAGPAAGRAPAPGPAWPAASCRSSSRPSAGSAPRPARRGAARRPPARAPRRTAARTSGPCARRSRWPTRRPAGSRARACSRPAPGSRRRRWRRRGRAPCAVPAVAGTSPSRILISVDLPAPLAPTSPVTPSPTVTSRWSSAVTDGYCFVSPTVSITATAST